MARPQCDTPPLFFYYSWLKLQTLDSFIFISSCELEVFEGINLLRLGKKTLGIGSLLKSHMRLHKFLLILGRLMGKKEEVLCILLNLD